MDHLLRPEGVKNFIKVTYNAEESEYYDDGEFLGFPGRRGWTEQDLLGENEFGGRSTEEVERFFQTWLFFGMAIEILKAAGISVQTNDFLCPEPGESGHVVNTERLPSILMEWKRLWPLPEGVSQDCTCKRWIDPNEIDCQADVCWKNFQHARDSDAWRRTRRILDRACVFMDRYCISLREGERLANHIWPIRDEISVSILALGFTLRSAAIKIYDIPQMGNKWGTGTSSLLRKILGQKWCKSDAAMAMEDLQIDGQYYIAASPSPSKEYLQAHSSCGEGRCISTVEEGTYETKHTSGCEKINCNIGFCYSSHGNDGDVDLGDSPSKFEKELIQIIARGGTPIIKWNEVNCEIVIIEYNNAVGLKPKYVAISHV
jgi:hypothetical protein